MKLQRVVVTGMGTVNGIGVGVKSSWSNLLKGKTGARKMQFPTLQGQFGCPITEDFDPTKYETSIGPSRAYSLANAMCDEALADAGIDTSDMPIDRDRFGLNLANLFGDEE